MIIDIIYNILIFIEIYLTTLYIIPSLIKRGSANIPPAKKEIINLNRTPCITFGEKEKLGGQSCPLIFWVSLLVFSVPFSEAENTTLYVKLSEIKVIITIKVTNII